VTEIDDPSWEHDLDESEDIDATYDVELSFPSEDECESVPIPSLLSDTAI
jgi:hypothetical protein